VSLYVCQTNHHTAGQFGEDRFFSFRVVTVINMPLEIRNRLFKKLFIVSKSSRLLCRMRKERRRSSAVWTKCGKRNKLMNLSSRLLLLLLLQLQCRVH
jgi:hypothetical protein